MLFRHKKSSIIQEKHVNDLFPVKLYLNVWPQKAFSCILSWTIPCGIEISLKPVHKWNQIIVRKSMILFIQSKWYKEHQLPLGYLKKNCKLMKFYLFLLANLQIDVPVDCLHKLSISFSCKELWWRDFSLRAFLFLPSVFFFLLYLPCFCLIFE